MNLGLKTPLLVNTRFAAKEFTACAQVGLRSHLFSIYVVEGIVIIAELLDRIFIGVSEAVLRALLHLEYSGETRNE